MHLGNGIICPVTGIPMLAVAGVTAFYAYKKARKNFSKDKIFPAIAVTGLVFALQMINFAIPATGSSGHIVGGVLLSAILGPYAAFLAMCSILLVQAVFFADGGLLALGCNIFNMGILACFVAYPLLYKPLAERNNAVLGALLASLAALQLGAIAVVAEGALSGSVALSSVMTFTGLMQMIHLPIGLAEGLVTAAIAAFAKNVSSKNLSYSFSAVALLLAGIISPYASQKPDGLEWSLLNISDSVVMQTQSVLYNISEALQAKTAIFEGLPYTLGSIAGLLAVAAIMYFAGIILTRKTVQEDA